VTAWPKKAKKRIHPATKERMEFFRQVQWAWKYTDYGLVTDLTEAVKGTPLLPRDLYLSGLAGRLLRFRTPEGILIVSVAAQDNVSETLDFITSEPGAMLIRGEDGWFGLSAGEGLEVLTIDSVSGLPAWQPSSGGGGSGGAPMPSPGPGELRQTVGDNWSTPSSLILTDCFVKDQQDIARLKWPVLSGGIASLYKPVIYDWGNTEIPPTSTLGSVLLATGPDQSFTGRTLLDLPLDAPLTVGPNQRLLIGIHRRSATVQTSPMSTILNRQAYFNTVATAAPPNPLPALTAGQRTYMSMWTEGA
jgi:hypothetical protein